LRKAHTRGIESYRDVNIVTLTTEAAGQSSVKDGDDKKQGRHQQKMFYCFVGDCLITASDAEAVKFVVSQIKGAGALIAIGRYGLYRDDGVRSGLIMMFAIYVNFKRLIKWLIDEDATGESQKEIANPGL